MSGRNSPGGNKSQSTDVVSKPEVPKTAKKVQTRFEVQAATPLTATQETEDIEAANEAEPAKNDEVINQGEAR